MSDAHGLLDADDGHVLLVYDETYQQALRDFPDDQPLRPVMGELAVALMRAYGLLDDPRLRIRAPRQATVDELERVHGSDYIARVRELDTLATARGTGFELQDRAYGLTSPTNPVFPGIHEAAATIAGGTALATLAVMAGQAVHAFVPLAGMHHAMRDRASGFCVYNDPAVAIAAALAAYPAARIAYVDLDAHHGDGVQALFWRDPRVLAISLHESGQYLFPGVGYVEDSGGGPGQGYTVNLPLEPFAGDDTFARAFAAMVPPLLRAFGPDLIMVQLGPDTHWTDPLTELGATVNLWPPLVDALHALAHELCQGRLVTLGSGCYQPYTVAPRVWTRAMAVLLDREDGLADDLPGNWLAGVTALTPVALPRTLSDAPAPALPAARQAAIDRAADAIIARIRAEIFPLHGIA